ncbi:hypothetical protein VTK56DRAFT_2005 [Thermocarpiscus australiensis]
MTWPRGVRKDGTNSLVSHITTSVVGLVLGKGRKIRRARSPVRFQRCIVCDLCPGLRQRARPDNRPPSGVRRRRSTDHRTSSFELYLS